jgi:hypothetical protein
MAHFAEINLENKITRVIVVNNEVLHDDKGVEKESIGVAFCQSLFGADTQWVQTSYNGKFRGQYAGVGMIYDPIKDEFISPASVDSVVTK